MLHITTRTPAGRMRISKRIIAVVAALTLVAPTHISASAAQAAQSAQAQAAQSAQAQAAQSSSITVRGGVTITSVASHTAVPTVASDVVNTYYIADDGTVTPDWQMRKGVVTVLGLAHTGAGDFAYVSDDNGRSTYIAAANLAEYAGASGVTGVADERGGEPVETLPIISASVKPDDAEASTVAEVTKVTEVTTEATTVTTAATEAVTEAPAPAYAAPNWNSKAYNGGNSYANIGLYGQCTWYAYGRAKEVTGVSLPWSLNARKWYAAAKASGFKVSATPRANSIVVWDGGSYGHVGFVESVSGNTVKFSHANYGNATYANHYTIASGIKQYRGVVTTTTAGMSKYGKVMGYIYL
ncbi:hypothetical protein FACS1894133_3340 [Clostridia bacterium]|nr:hypothetical protein FACS1894133_3340 [Clostridia bacterium]